MSGKLSWIFELVDFASGPAKSIAKAIDSIGTALNGVTKASDNVKPPKAAVAEGWAGIATGLNQVADLGSKVTDVLAGVANKVLDLGEAGAKYAIDATTFRQNTERALGAVLRSKEAAQGVVAQAVRFAAASPFQTRDVVDWSKSLIVGGFKTQEVPVLLKTLGNFGALNNLDTGKIGSIIQDLTKLRGEGHLTGRVMESLNANGVSAGPIYEKLGKMLGTTADGARKLEAAGKITADQGLFAIVSRVKELSNGFSLLGDASAEVAGLWSTIQSRPFELLSNVDVTKGWAALRGGLSNLADLLDAGIKGGFGERLKNVAQDTFSSVFETLFGGISGAGGKNNLAAGLNTALDVIVGIESVVRSAWPYVVAFGDAFGGVLKVELAPLLKLFGIFDAGKSPLGLITNGLSLLGYMLGSVIGAAVYLGTAFVGLMAGLAAFGVAILGIPDAIIGAFGAAWDWLSALPGQFMEWAESSGASLIDGMINGIESGASRLWASISGLGDSAEEALKQSLGINSPSKVFADLGTQIPAGFSIGIDSGAPAVAGSVGAMAQIPDAIDLGGGSGGGGGGRAINVEVNFTTGPEHAGSIDGLKSWIKMGVREAIEEALRQAAMESGTGVS